MGVVDMESHGGLRGFLAVYIVVFHLLLLNRQHPFINIMGSSLMPFFFVLSGFSLVVGYGRKKYLLQNDICGVRLSGSNPESDNCVKFDSWKFYQNRFARVMPLYYFDSLALGLPLFLSGYGFSDWQQYPMVLVVNILPVSTLLCNALGGPLDAPAWTICTLLCFWLVFPLLLPRVQRMTSDELVQAITKCYWFQFFLILIMCFVFIPTLSFTGLTIDSLGCFFTMHPISRFPVFFMGVYAGELCMRHQDSMLPWPSTYFRFFPSSSTDTGEEYSLLKLAENNSDTVEGIKVCTDSTIWKSRVTRQSATLSLLFFLVSVCYLILQLCSIPAGVMLDFLLQGIVAFAELEIVVALTRDGGKTRISEWFRSSVGNWFGDRSMAIYLVHFPLILYVCFMANGEPIHFPRHYVGKCDDYPRDSDERRHCENVFKKWLSQNLIPLWGFPIVLVLTPILADLTYRFIEEPCRKLLRAC